MAESERGERREVRGAEERAHKIRKWRGSTIKDFPKLAFLIKFSDARVGHPRKPHLQELHMAAFRERERERRRGGRERAR